MLIASCTVGIRAGGRTLPRRERRVCEMNRLLGPLFHLETVRF